MVYTKDNIYMLYLATCIIMTRLFISSFTSHPVTSHTHTHTHTVVTVTFGRPELTVDEGIGNFTMCVTIDRVTLQPVTVTIEAREGSALSPEGMYIYTLRKAFDHFEIFIMTHGTSK